MMDRLRIMVVDDNTVNLATLEQELSGKYDIIPMLTGRRAIKYLYRETCDLILLDVNMPIMDGVETLREIRTQENGVDVPVIFLTAKRDAQTVLEGSKLGIVDYITKPFDADNLRERIDIVFKRLGVVPLENCELLDRINTMYKLLLDLKADEAYKEVEEILQYKMNNDIVGRLSNVKDKLEAGNTDGAIEMIERILDLLDKILDEVDRADLIPISSDEMKIKLEAIVSDIDGFKSDDAINKLKSLKAYDLNDRVRKVVKTTINYLKSYDDVEAKKLIVALIKDVNNM